jgi:(1->4)-alpha-D-glucan 1-alpha-D-glucosylmutase
MRIPSATYRIQFTPDFGFVQAHGISDLYASPIFHARSGSNHGYDVVNPNALNPELGTPGSFDELLDEVRERKMGWLQDIVPNHMAFDHANPYLVDVLENGSASRYYHFFDIVWDHFYDVLHNRLLAPFLGSFYGEALENGEVRLVYDREGFSVNYFNLRFALRIESYRRLLTPCLEALREKLGEESADYIQLLGVLYVLETLRTQEGDLDRYNQIKFIKNTLWNLYRKTPSIRAKIDEVVSLHNGTPGDKESFTPLDTFLSEQNFRLSFWKVASEEINYRRFFSINDLISLNAEREEVFTETHQLVLRLAREGRFTGLRIDHIDGLCDPAGYLQRLREELGDIYLVVEKIVEPDEPLPSWPVEGSTGYEFMNRITGVLCNQKSQKAFSRLYASFTGLDDDYEELVYEKKKLMVERHMTGDINNLAHLLKDIAGRHRYGSDITMYGLRRSLIEIMAFFPVYRSYFRPEEGREADRKYVRRAIHLALEQNPGLVNEFRFLQKILLLDFDDFLPEEEKKEWLHFIMRFQQFTGPLMAKGFEDTLLYVFNRLLSLNEVGGSPDRFGFTTEEFHAYQKRRSTEWPNALSASATHDTKRGEDVRARLNVLSELPQDWGRQIKSWSRINRAHKGRIGRRKMPSANDEYFLYQTLLGTWPFGDFDRRVYLDRLHEYAVKAVREAKVHTAWIKPDQDYEQTYLDFIEKVLADESFLQEFLPFQKRIAWFGVVNSLAQTLLKLAAPGVPDIYQGTEMWDFSLVDPDNRRPVDFDFRRRTLQELEAGAKSDLASLLRELMSSPEDGRIKLFLVWRALSLRRRCQGVFEQGDYLPLAAQGRCADHLIAFARRHEERQVIALAPRLPASLTSEGEWPVGGVWADTAVLLPDGSAGMWRDALTDREFTVSERLPLDDLLKLFPVALLEKIR